MKDFLKPHQELFRQFQNTSDRLGLGAALSVSSTQAFADKLFAEQTMLPSSLMAQLDAQIKAFDTVKLHALYSEVDNLVERMLGSSANSYVEALVRSERRAGELLAEMSEISAIGGNLLPALEQARALEERLSTRLSIDDLAQRMIGQSFAKTQQWFESAARQLESLPESDESDLAGQDVIDTLESLILKSNEGLLEEIDVLVQQAAASTKRSLLATALVFLRDVLIQIIITVTVMLYSAPLQEMWSDVVSSLSRADAVAEISRRAQEKYGALDLHDYRIVNAKNLRLRDGPSREAEIIGRLNKGQLVLLEETEEGWARIEAAVGDGNDREIVEGWAALAYLSRVERSNAQQASAGSL